MQIFPDFTSQRAAHLKRPVVTIGTFDGVHKGHREVLKTLVAEAARLNGTPGVLTFHIHPRKVLTGTGPLWLTSVPYRMRLFQQAGVKFTTFIPFSRELSLLSPREFVKQFLVEQLRVASVVMGYDSCFGHKGSGTPELMAEFGREYGFAVAKVPKVECNPLTPTLSSSAIRGFIEQGDLAKATQLLGRPCTLLSAVVRDQGRGAGIGFPTANLAADEVLLPQRGVYATQVFVGLPAGGSLASAGVAALAAFNGPHPAVTNIGVRPTMAAGAVDSAGAPRTVVESHLLDYTGDLYGRLLAVVFVERLRGEQAFAGVDELKAQIGRDIVQARAIFARRPAPTDV